MKSLGALLCSDAEGKSESYCGMGTLKADP